MKNLITLMVLILFLSACENKENGTDDNVPVTPTQWIEYPGDGLMWGEESEMTMSEFPGITFYETTNEITAVDGSGNKETLFYGLPIWDVYLHDLNGDGLRELCATASFGSGFVDMRVIVYDYALKKEYILADRMVYDYELSIENEILVVTQTNNSDGTEIAKGELKIINGELTADGIVRPDSAAMESAKQTEAPANDNTVQNPSLTGGTQTEEPQTRDEVPEALPNERTAADTRHEAFYYVVKSLYNYDSGLNPGIKYIAIDMTDVPEEIRTELEDDLRELAESYDCELLLNTHESLVESGYIDRMPPEGEGKGFSEGILFSFSESNFNGDTFTTRAEKYRGPLGAVSAVFKAQFVNGEWVVGEPEDIMMA